jgi:hypothetical protein
VLNSKQFRQKIKTKYTLDDKSCFTDSEVRFIAKHKCKCSLCGCDFLTGSGGCGGSEPYAIAENNELLCCDCYYELYQAICPICESVYDIFKSGIDYYITINNQKCQLAYKSNVYAEAVIVVLAMETTAKERERLQRRINYNPHLCQNCIDEFVKNE